MIMSPGTDTGGSADATRAGFRHRKSGNDFSDETFLNVRARDMTVMHSKRKVFPMTRQLWYLALWAAAYLCFGITPASTGFCQEDIASAGRQDSLLIEDISPAAALDLIDSNKGSQQFVILDVRTPEEFGEGHLDQAINIDYKSRTFKDSLAVLDKSKTYLVYCRVGNRSAKSAMFMKEMGFNIVYNMLEGIRGWIRNDYPVIQ